MLNITIRPIEENDHDDWFRLWKLYLAFYKTELSDEVGEYTFKRILHPDVQIWAALAIDTQTGKPVGMVNYFTHVNTWSSKDKLLLNDLYVDEASRLNGIGRMLIEYVFQKADEMGTPEVYWNTQFENHRAQMLYTKVGRKMGLLSYERVL